MAHLPCADVQLQITLNLLLANKSTPPLANREGETNKKMDMFCYVGFIFEVWCIGKLCWIHKTCMWLGNVASPKKLSWGSLILPTVSENSSGLTRVTPSICSLKLTKGAPTIINSRYCNQIKIFIKG